MATRSGIEPQTLKDISKEPYRRLEKAWLFWAIGLVMEAIELKPTSISAGGLSLSIQRPEIIQGILYWIALFQTWHVFMKASPSLNQYATTRSGGRSAIWSALPKGTRSLRGMTREKLIPIKTSARNMIIMLNVLPMVFVSPVVFFIVVFNPLKLLRALGAVVGLY